MAFADDLAEWTDDDVAAYALGVALSVFEPGQFLAVKHVFWTANPLGEHMHNALIELWHAGVLEYREVLGGNEFRWRRTRGADGSQPHPVEGGCDSS